MTAAMPPLRSVLTHPIMAMVVVIAACLLGRDSYPLNNFPMYADPGPEPSVFTVVADGADQPIDIRRITGETSAKVGKKYVDARNQIARAAGIREGAKATPEIKQQAWQDVAGRLERLAIRRKKMLPPVLRLKAGEIFQENGGFREVISPVAEARIGGGKASTSQP